MSTCSKLEAAHSLKREFRLWSSFAFAFAFISPIVALYGIFALAITTAGPSFWWAFLIVFVGQFIVALVFGTLVSRWPLEGSIYQWSRRLAGNAFGWFAGWAYMWTLVIAMATVALGAAGFLASIFGIQSPTGGQKALIALGILLGGTVLNLIGRQALKLFMTASIAAEIIGSLGLGTWLLLFHRANGIDVLFHGGSTPGYLSLSGPFMIAVAFVGWTFVGFESAGSIAEEVHDPRRNVPKAVLMSLTFIAIVVMYSSLAIILAIPDLNAVTSGAVTDPVSDTLTAQLGAGVAKPIEVLFVIGFLASFLALQTSASRVIWAFSRDRALPCAHQLARLSIAQRVPTLAIGITTAIGAALFLLSDIATNIYMLMVNFTVGGFFIAFLFPLSGNALTRLRGRWHPGPFDLGRWGVPVGVIASIWAAFEFLNISWPRPVNSARWLDWSVWIAMGFLAVIGTAIYLSVRRRIVPIAEIDEAERLDEADDITRSDNA
jgi:amino acid transporter